MSIQSFYQDSSSTQQSPPTSSTGTATESATSWGTYRQGGRRREPQAWQTFTTSHDGWWDDRWGIEQEDPDGDDTYNDNYYRPPRAEPWQDRDVKDFKDRANAPEFDGIVEDTGKGDGVRNYLRRLEIWEELTTVPKKKQAIVLFYKLRGRAWTDAETLDIKELQKDHGIDIYKAWVRQKYRDLEITTIGDNMKEFFRNLHLKKGQSVREFNNEFDRLWKKLSGMGCGLPTLALARYYLYKLMITDQQEATLLSSVGNEYDLEKLQKAALTQIRIGCGRRGRYDDEKEKKRKGYHGHYTKGTDRSRTSSSHGSLIGRRGGDRAREAYVTMQTAKMKLRDAKNLRGFRGGGKGGGKGDKDYQKKIDERLQKAKEQSLCSRCKQKGHWHKDDVCPLNGGSGTAGAGSSKPHHSHYTTHVAFMADNFGNERPGPFLPVGAANQEVPWSTIAAGPEPFQPAHRLRSGRSRSPADEFITYMSGTLGDEGKYYGITDTACSKMVAGMPWYRAFRDNVNEAGYVITEVDESEGFKFGASRTHRSTFAAITPMAIGGKILVVRVSIVPCDVPLLLSRPALEALDMHIHLAGRTADFGALDLRGYALGSTTASHPTVRVNEWPEIHVLLSRDMYAADEREVRLCAVYNKSDEVDVAVLGYGKRIMSGHSFTTWRIAYVCARDFWIETYDEIIRIHVSCRSSAYAPEKYQQYITEQRFVECVREKQQVQLITCEHDNWPKISTRMFRHRFLVKYARRTRLFRPSHLTAAILAMAEPRPVSYMMKNELLEELRGYGANVNPAWTQQELRVVTREERLERGLAKAKDGVKLPTKKEDLIKMCTAEGLASAPGFSRSTNQRQYADQLREVRRPHVRRAEGETTRLPRLGDQDSGREQRLQPSSADLGELGRKAPGEGIAETWEEFHDAESEAEGKHEPEKAKRGPRRGIQNGRRAAGGDAGSDPRVGDKVGSPPPEQRDTSSRATAGNQLVGSELLAHGDEPPRARRVHPCRDALRGGGRSRRGRKQAASQGAESSPDTDTQALDEDSAGESPAIQNDSSTRRRIKKGLRKKLRGGINKAWMITAAVASVFYSCMATAVSSTAGEFVAPIREAAQVFQTGLGHERPWMLEVFCGGEAGTETTRAFTDHGKLVLEPRDILFGHDLKNIKKRERLYDDVVNLRPRMVWLAFPCRLYGSFTHLNYRTPERKQLLRRLRRRERVFLEMTRDIFQLQTSRGDHAAAENPWKSAAWQERPMTETLRLPGVNMFRTDMCAHGLKDPDGEGLHEKATGLMTTSPVFEKHLGKRCQGGHYHVHVQGGNSQRAGHYTRKFARQIRRAVLEIYASRAYMVAEDEAGPPEEADQDMEPPVGLIGAAAITFTDSKISPAIKTGLKKLHQNLGHPSNEDLCRSLRLGGAATEVIKAIKCLRCTTCIRMHGRGSARPAKLPAMGNFNENVGLDIIVIYDQAGTKYMALSCVDLNTTFHVVTLAKNTQAATLREAFVRCWAEWAGPPKKVHVDLDSGFKAEFSEMISFWGAKTSLVAGQAPWQHGTTERQGGWWKTIWAKTVEHETINGVEEVLATIPEVTQAKNVLRRKNGFSPCQWVTGSDPKLAAAAFLNGVKAPRGLYMEQPKEGLYGLVPGQLLEIIKGVFGLATSPRLWWGKLASSLKEMKFRDLHGREVQFIQSRLDPCHFLLRDSRGNLVAMLCTHVDDVKLAYAEGYEQVARRFGEEFPIGEWDELPYTYTGSQYQVEEEMGDLVIRQTDYVERRLEPLKVKRGREDAEAADPEEMQDNMSAVGGISWLAGQTRPDLSCGCSMSQKKQKSPRVKDLKETARLIKQAQTEKDVGIRIGKLDKDNLNIFVFHDAAWANVTSGECVDDPTQQQIDNKEVYSQIGYTMFLATNDVKGEKGGRANLIDWRSHGCPRVCRSTFAAETMACAEALEAAIAMRGMLLEILHPGLDLRDVDAAMLPIECITDCKSLYDTMHKDGVAKAPSEKRLMLDLSAIREMLMEEVVSDDLLDTGGMPIRWIPTEYMLADGMTKVMKNERLLEVLRTGQLKLRVK
ncbi:unnamed protein product [Polarella glacialis]|uniref:Integrase catalytic domain-containing protein n=1 Tax=Polarella glacialis TaxID=89957 RepID=A0A813FLS4_POLGL|nr:unnamed protein product [Polarella glacialis]